MLNAHVTLDPIDPLYIAALLGDRRRPIDCYIDYFGIRGTSTREMTILPGPELTGDRR